MGEWLPGNPDALAAQLVDGVRRLFPGIVEEWERQRADGNEDWPEFSDTAGAVWWLESEISVAEGFVKGDETGTEHQIIAYCRDAAEQLRAALLGKPSEH